MRYEQYAKNLAEEYKEKGISDGSSFPDMQLYMDQMVAFLNEELAIYGKNGSGPVTKSMVSNYTKHHMIPGPDGKRYSRSHCLFALMVFYLKECFSMDQVERFVKPLITNLSSEWDDEIDIQAMYKEVTEFAKEAEADFPQQLEKRIESIKAFLEEKNQDDDISELTMLILMLVMRSNAERFLAEKLLDEYFPDPKAKKK